MLKLHSEEGISFYAEDSKIVSKSDSVFYNPEATLSRDLCCLVSLVSKPKTILDLNAGSGIFGIRLFKASNASKVIFYDINKFSNSIAEKNLKLNNITNYEIKTENAVYAKIPDADFIIIDPFGSPAAIYKNIISQIKLNTFISLKATDFGVLSGNYPKRAKKVYDLTIYKNPCPKELAIRSLLLFAEKEANKQNKSIKPVLSYATNYYIHCIIKVIKKQKTKKSILNYCDKCLRTSFLKEQKNCKCKNRLKYTEFLNVPKSDVQFIEKIEKLKTNLLNNKSIIKELEKAKNQILYEQIYNIPKLCKKEKTKIPKREDFEKQGFIFLSYDKDTATKRDDSFNL